MARIVLNVLDDEKAESLIVLLRGLSYIDVQVEDNMKIWNGSDLRALDNPVSVSDFKIYSREELHER
jgi:hypothetical protein